MKKYQPVWLLASALLVAFGACGQFGANDSPSPPEQTATAGAIATSVAATMQAQESGQSTQPPQATPTSTPQATSSPAATPTIDHAMVPSSPISTDSFMTDRLTRPLSSEKRAIADSFDQLLLERPYTSQPMEYRAQLDITRGELSQSGPWYYATIFLAEAPPQGSSAMYAIEFDLDRDGRGDWLVRGEAPDNTDWTVAGVQALHDANDNVGGDRPLRSEAPPQQGDGYEQVAFDSGQGDDPDAAWIRRSPSSSTNIQLAVKTGLIAAPGNFLWGVWADNGPQEAGWFDYNDHFTLDQAGSPVITNDHYPLRELAQMDNTCRWGFGYEPDADEPGVCGPPPTPTPEEPDPPPEATPCTPTLENDYCDVGPF